MIMKITKREWKQVIYIKWLTVIRIYHKWRLKILTQIRNKSQDSRVNIIPGLNVGNFVNKYNRFAFVHYFVFCTEKIFSTFMCFLNYFHHQSFAKWFKLLICTRHFRFTNHTDFRNPSKDKRYHQPIISGIISSQNTSKRHADIHTNMIDCYREGLWLELGLNCHKRNPHQKSGEFELGSRN